MRYSIGFPLSFIIVLALLPAPPASAQSFPDALHLTNGRIVEGYILEVIPGESVTMRLQNGRSFRYQMGEIVRITKATPAPAPSTQRASASSSGSYVLAAQAGILRQDDARVFIDTPVNQWMERDGRGPALSAQGYYEVSRGFLLGFYAEYEKMRWASAQFPDTNGAFDRIGVGVAYLGRFPREYNRVAVEVGGRLGISYLPPSALDSQAGVEYGAFLGPLVKLNQRFALGVHAGGFYQGYRGGRVPTSIRTAQLRLQTVVYYAL